MLESYFDRAIAIIAGYLLAGMGVSIAVQVRGLVRIDPGLASSGWPARLIVIPGMIVFWPVMIRRWWRGPEPVADADERPGRAVGLRRRHAVTTVLGAVLLPLVLALALWSRPLEIAANNPAHGVSLPGTEEPLTQVAATMPAAFDLTQLTVNLLRDPAPERWQVEFDASEDLGVPSVVAYWRPQFGQPPAAPGQEAIALGAVWGPATRRYLLPRGDGAILLWSVAQRRVVGELSIEGLRNAGGR